MSAQTALDLLDQFGPYLNARELARIFGLTLNAFYKHARAGAYDAFKVTPAIGPRCYSKQIVLRHLAGEDVRRPVGSFGRKRSA